MRRVWAMPNVNTMEVCPIKDVVMSYVKPNMDIIDPFARNCHIANWTNDLNPETSAKYHLDVMDFLRMCQSKVAADIVIFDPPYSHYQIREVYDSIGLMYSEREASRFGYWSAEKDLINQMLKVGGLVISFGWNTIGMGRGRAYDIVEILCVCHGRAHNDTLVTVERKIAHQEALPIGALDTKEICHTAPNNRMLKCLCNYKELASAGGKAQFKRCRSRLCVVHGGR